MRTLDLLYTCHILVGNVEIGIGRILTSGHYLKDNLNTIAVNLHTDRSQGREREQAGMACL